MKYKEELIIIRHGRSQHNMGESENLDCGLTEFGLHQSRNVGKFLNDKFFSSGNFALSQWKIITSPFLRCLETTHEICGGLNQDLFPIVVDPLLREYLNHSGKSVHVPNRKKHLSYNYNWSSFPEDGMNFEGEQNETFLERIHAAHDMLPPLSIVITHGLPAYALKHVAAYNANYVPVWDNSIDNCSITWIRNGRVVWSGKNLYHEVEYKSDNYQRCFILEP